MNRIKFISNFNYTGISIFLIKIIIGLSFFIAIIINALAYTEQPDISIIYDVNIERPVKHRIKELTNVLEKKAFLIRL